MSDELTFAFENVRVSLDDIEDIGEARVRLTDIEEKLAVSGLRVTDIFGAPLSAQEQHQALDLLLARFLVAKPHKLPSTTTVLELLHWSHSQLPKKTEGQGKEGAE